MYLEKNTAAAASFFLISHGILQLRAWHMVTNNSQLCYELITLCWLLSSVAVGIVCLFDYVVRSLGIFKQSLSGKAMRGIRGFLWRFHNLNISTACHCDSFDSFVSIDEYSRVLEDSRALETEFQNQVLITYSLLEDMRERLDNKERELIVARELAHCSLRENEKVLELESEIDHLTEEKQIICWDKELIERQSMNAPTLESKENIEAYLQDKLERNIALKRELEKEKIGHSSAKKDLLTTQGLLEIAQKKLEAASTTGSTHQLDTATGSESAIKEEIKELPRDSKDAALPGDALEEPAAPSTPFQQAPENEEEFSPLTVEVQELAHLLTGTSQLPENPEGTASQRDNVEEPTTVIQSPQRKVEETTAVSSAVTEPDPVIQSPWFQEDIASLRDTVQELIDRVICEDSPKDDRSKAEGSEEALQQERLPISNADPDSSNTTAKIASRILHGFEALLEAYSSIQEPTTLLESHGPAILGKTPAVSNSPAVVDQAQQPSTDVSPDGNEGEWVDVNDDEDGDGVADAVEDEQQGAIMPQECPDFQNETWFRETWLPQQTLRMEASDDEVPYYVESDFDTL